MQATSARWVPTGNLNIPRSNHTATRLPNGNVLVVGGWSSAYSHLPVNSAELYDVATGTWSLTGSLNAPRASHTATLLQNGKVLVVGGIAEGPTANPIPNPISESYDPTTGTWSSTAPPTHCYGTTTLLPNGKVLLTGTDEDLSPCAELYDPTSGTWRPAGRPASVHDGHTATLLQDGNVLVVGGRVDDAGDFDIPSPSEAELYDPASDSWRGVGNGGIVGYHTATLLADGKVLMAGGDVAPLFDRRSTKLFDPATEKFVDTGNLIVGRYCCHTATLLPNGKVLVAGSGPGGVGLSNSAELYDPGNGNWTSTSGLNAGREGHTATLLPNGKVLVAGGWGALGSAELYSDAALTSWPIGPGFTGSWYDPSQSGHGLFVEVLPNNGFLAFWFSFNPVGSEQSWFGGVGTYSDNTATITDAYQTTGGRWIPNFDPRRIVNNRWGTLTFTFTDCNHGKVDFDSVLGYGSGSMNLTRLTTPAGLTCP